MINDRRAQRAKVRRSSIKILELALLARRKRRLYQSVTSIFRSDCFNELQALRRAIPNDPLDRIVGRQYSQPSEDFAAENIYCGESQLRQMIHTREGRQSCREQRGEQLGSQYRI